MKISVPYLLTVLCAMSILAWTSCKTNKRKGGKSYNHVKEFGAKSNDGRSDAIAIQKAFDSSSRTVAFEAKGVYHIDRPIVIKDSKKVEGNGATLICKPQHSHMNMFVVAGDEVVVKNLHFVSENKHRFASYKIIKNWSSNLRAIEASPKNKRISKLSIYNCSAKNFAYITKLNKVDQLVIDGLISSGNMMGVFCEDCGTVAINNFKSERNTANSRFTHHIYLNSCREININHCELKGGAGQAINIKTEKNLPANKVAKISNIFVEGTSGFFFQSINECYISDINLIKTPSLFTCSQNVGTLIIDQVNSKSNGRVTIIQSFDKNFPTRYVSINNLISDGPINIYGHNIKKLKFSNSEFTNILDLEKKAGQQNVIYIKAGQLGGQVTFNDCRFIQKKKHNQNRLIRNESSSALVFNNNIVDIANPVIPQLSYLDPRTKTTIEDNTLIGVKHLKLPESKGRIIRNGNTIRE